MGTYHDKARYTPGVGWQIYEMILKQVATDTRQPVRWTAMRRYCRGSCMWRRLFFANCACALPVRSQRGSGQRS